jgi:hypothetical protein
LCDFNGLVCLPVANCTTGAQRFLAALSNRYRSHLLTRGMRAVERELEFSVEPFNLLLRVFAPQGKVAQK